MQAVQRSALCRFRRELSNAYFLAKFGFDTAEYLQFLKIIRSTAAAAENELRKVCPIKRSQCRAFSGLLPNRGPRPRDDRRGARAGARRARRQALRGGALRGRQGLLPTLPANPKNSDPIFLPC